MRHVRRPFLHHILLLLLRLLLLLHPVAFPAPSAHPLIPVPVASSCPAARQLLSPPRVPPSSSGGSNGCGGICQAVTHPHGRILGYVFARSLPPPALRPRHVPSSLPPPCPPPVSLAPPRRRLFPRADLHPSICPSVVAYAYVIPVFIFYRRDVTAS